MKYIFYPFILLVTFSIHSQTNCVGGFAGVYPCNKVNLLSYMNFSAIGGTASTQGNDCWGWKDPLTNKEYAIMGCTSHTAFIDISNPTSPIYVGKVVSHNNVNSIWRDIEVYNNYAFIVSEANGHGMQVFDLTRLRNVTSPQIFTPDTRYSGFGNCHTIAINEASGFAYCMGTSTYTGGPHIVNIQNPLNPVFASGYSAQGYTHDAQIVNYNGPDTQHNGKEIYFGCNQNRVIILDVTNKSNPVLLSTFFYPNTGYTHQGWLTENKKYYIVGDELDETDFGNNTKSIVIDMTDLDQPVLKLEYIGTTPAIDHNGIVKGNKFHLANYRAGYRVMDITNIDNNQMAEIGFFDTYPANNTANFNGAWSVYPLFASGSIVVSDIDRGFFLLKLDPSLTTTEFTQNEFKIFPNPANFNFTITSETGIEKIEIFDLLGKKVLFKDKLSTYSVIVDISSLQSGLYIVKSNDSNVQKLIIK